MELLGVRVEVPANTPVVILREQPEPHRVLPILIGSPEASAIHTALSGIVAPRPMTHDLIVELLRTTKATLDKVVVTEIRDHTFYAELHLRVSGNELLVSCRPSDAIAVACRTGATIYAEDALLAEVGLVAADGLADEEPGDEAILDEFRDFLEEIKPEDFEA
ncbi:MAG: bifunctional nuclease family protein [Ilumatobacteraceae bacterium]